MMPAKEGGIKACYNVQTAVDAGSHMIADFRVTDTPSDRGQLYDSIELCRKDLELGTVNAIADKGYESAADIERCLMNGIAPDVGFIQDREERVFPLDYVEREITPQMQASQARRTFRPASMPGCCRTAMRAVTSASRFRRWGSSVASSATKTGGSPVPLAGSCLRKRKRSTARNTPARKPAGPAPTAVQTRGRRSTSTSVATASTCSCSCTATPTARSSRSRRRAERAAQQLRQVKARRKARHGVHPARHSPAKAPPAHQRASLRHDQARRRRPLLPVQGEREGHRRVRALRAGLQPAKGDPSLRRGAELIELYRRTAMPKIRKIAEF